MPPPIRSSTWYRSNTDMPDSSRMIPTGIYRHNDLPTPAHAERYADRFVPEDHTIPAHFMSWDGRRCAICPIWRWRCALRFLTIPISPPPANRIHRSRLILLFRLLRHSGPCRGAITIPLPQIGSRWISRCWVSTWASQPVYAAHAGTLYLNATPRQTGRSMLDLRRASWRRTASPARSTGIWIFP